MAQVRSLSTKAGAKGVTTTNERSLQAHRLRKRDARK